VILLDTHVLIWAMQSDRRLGKVARDQIDIAMRGEGVAVSAISFWETAMLVQRKRVDVGGDARDFRRDVLKLGVTETPVTGDIAIMAGGLQGLHGDPADRLLIATTLSGGMTLVTADAELLRWNRKLKRIDARR
jgi:PIN domain nuclease of toxin-antitoxin system